MEDQIQKIFNLQLSVIKQKVAVNFILTHIISLLDEQSSEDAFSVKLSNELESSLNKLGHTDASPIKNEINRLLQPPVQTHFGPKSIPFIK